MERILERLIRYWTNFGKVERYWTKFEIYWKILVTLIERLKEDGTDMERFEKFWIDIDRLKEFGKIG